MFQILRAVGLLASSRRTECDNSNAASQAALVLCHAMPASTASEFRRISKGMKSAGHCFVLFHGQAVEGNSEAVRFPCHVFTDESLATLPYKWLFENKVVPGSTHFPLMEFFSKFPDYDYYWLIEGDVKFSGNWKRFFNAFTANNADFVASYIRNHGEDPAWYWWPTLSHPMEEIPLADRVASFNPIYRISKQALKYLHGKHCAGWCGHFEVLIPTLLFHGGFRLQDIGGCGRFVAPGTENRFYTKKTVRHIPPFRRTGWRKNKLYHPVKSPLKSGRISS